MYTSVYIIYEHTYPTLFIFISTSCKLVTFSALDMEISHWKHFSPWHRSSAIFTADHYVYFVAKAKQVILFLNIYSQTLTLKVHVGGLTLNGWMTWVNVQEPEWRQSTTFYANHLLSVGRHINTPWKQESTEGAGRYLAHSSCTGARMRLGARLF